MNNTDTTLDKSPTYAYSNGGNIGQNSSFHSSTLKYIMPPTHKKSKNKIMFKKILDDVLDKKNWQEKWKKIKDFVKKKGIKGQSQVSERDQVFNAILALYAGDEEDEVFSELAILYEKYPEEVEFYVPQLCTYLFHFNVYQPRGSAIHPATH